MLKRRSWRVVVGLALFIFVVAGVAVFFRLRRSPQAAAMSPEVAASGRSFLEAALTSTTFDRAGGWGVVGKTTSYQTYFVTLGQWYTFNDMGTRDDGPFSRDMPVFILQGIGDYTEFGMPNGSAFDAFTIAVLIDTGEVLGMRTSPHGIPQPEIDVNRPDARYIITPQAPAPLGLSKRERRATATAAALTATREATDELTAATAAP